MNKLEGKKYPDPADSRPTLGDGKHKRAVAVSVLYSLTVLLCGYLFFLGRDISQNKERCGFIAENETRHIVTTIDCVMARTHTLEALVQDNSGDIGFFKDIADAIYDGVMKDTGVALKNLALAPNGVVAAVYPYTGNESLMVSILWT